MPFTLAHVIAARPLWRALGRQLPLSGIVVGSVAPDLEYLAHFDTERTIGHQLHGVRLRLDGWGIETTVIGAILGAMAAGLVTATLILLAVRRFS